MIQPPGKVFQSALPREGGVGNGSGVLCLLAGHRAAGIVCPHGAQRLQLYVFWNKNQHRGWKSLSQWGRQRVIGLAEVPIPVLKRVVNNFYPCRAVYILPQYNEGKEI